LEGWSGGALTIASRSKTATTRASISIIETIIVGTTATTVEAPIIIVKTIIIEATRSTIKATVSTVESSIIIEATIPTVESSIIIEASSIVVIIVAEWSELERVEESCICTVLIFII